MPPFSAQGLKEDKLYKESLGSDIWLVDDHRWAYYIWEEQRIEKSIDSFCLVHVDYHWDGGNEFHGLPAKEQELLNANLEAIHDLVVEDRWITFDSFISPAIIRRLIKEVHFYCTQHDGSDVAIDDELLINTGTAQYIHTNLATLSEIDTPLPLIFDFCLDIFNKSDMWNEGDIWDEHEMLELLEACKNIVKKAKLVTVSLSFGYSGTPEDTRRLAEFVIPLFHRWRNETQ